MFFHVRIFVSSLQRKLLVSRVDAALAAVPFMASCQLAGVLSRHRTSDAMCHLVRKTVEEELFLELAGEVIEPGRALRIGPVSIGAAL